MIIEFIGCTGAGKTTLIAAVRQRLAQQTTVVSGFDVAAAPLGLDRVRHPTGRNLLQEALGLPFFLAAGQQHWPLVKLAVQQLTRPATTALLTLNNLRSLARKLGGYELQRRFGHNRIVLVDEGTALLPHNIFVYNDIAFTHAEIAQLVNLLPLPDLIVYARAPVATLITRTLHRPDPPRELRGLNAAQIAHYIERAVKLFDDLAALPAIRTRLLLAEPGEQTDPAWAAAVARIADQIHSAAAAQPLSDLQTAEIRPR